MIASFLKKKKATLTELQRLTGVLNFACSVVVPGLSVSQMAKPPL